MESIVISVEMYYSNGMMTETLAQLAPDPVLREGESLDALRLSRAIFSVRDMRNIGKRLLVQSLQARRRRAGSSGAGSAVPQAALRTVDGEWGRG